jgi:hypothetical protein
MDKLNLILSTLSKFGRLCDDCISIETNILPRQTVNKICRNPGNLIVINREKGTCPTCNKYKINNSLNSVTSSISHKCEITHLTKKVISTSSYSTNKRNQEQSRASKQREKRRNSPSTVRFKLEIELLLEKADAQISYCMKKDLAAMTDMAFYKYRPKVIKIGLTKKEIIKGYVLVLSNANDIVLSKKALRELSKNQSQTLRTAAPRYGKAKDIWEHAIPAKVIVDELIKMIESSCFKGIDRLLELYEIAGQRPLTKEDNKLLDTLKSSMPNGWNWRDADVDCFARYNAVDIEMKAK